jgi:hypothetical protein
MKLSKTLWCVSFIVTAVFLMPVFAETPVGQLDSMNNIAATGWADLWASGYMLQAPPGEVNEGTGSMKIDFTLYPGISPYTPKYHCKPQRTFSPVLDVNYQNQAITLWVWSADVNDSRSQTASSRLETIILYDNTWPLGASLRNTGSFTVPPLKNVGWNKVIAPFRNFMWRAGDSPGTFMNPEDANWSSITRIRLFTTCESDPCGSAIYMDDLRLEVAPDSPFTLPCPIASCDNLVDELWDELRGSGVMLQTPPDDVNGYEPNGTMMIDFRKYGISRPDICPSLYFIPALDFTDDYNDWAITVWLWTDLVLDSKVKEIILHDGEWNLGRFRVPLTLSAGWNKVTARLDEFLWNKVGDDKSLISPDEVRWDAILSMEIWTECWERGGNQIYLDDFRFEPAVEALSEAVVYNADYGTITVDGNAADWADLVDSDILDFDLQAVPDPNGNLYVKYRLAWDANYLYILVEEQTGDGIATEADDLGDFSDPSPVGRTEWYDSLALFFDFKNCRYPGIASHINFFLFLGLSSTERTDLMFALTNGKWGDQSGYDQYGVYQPGYDPLATANGSVATSGTLGSRVIEAKIKWSDLDSRIFSWLLPEGGLAAAVTAKPGSGYIFGCDPRLCDTELNVVPPWTTERGLRWLSGGQPSGRDTNSTDVRLVWSAGDLDYDCDVDFMDLQVLVENWLDDGCNNLNDFCNGADIVINGEVNFVDYAQLALRWLE